MFTPSIRQANIFAAYEALCPGGTLQIGAVAGSGKSTTLEQLIARMSEEDRSSTLLCAFGREIKLALEERVKRNRWNCTVKTLHGVGWGCLSKHYTQTTGKKWNAQCDGSTKYRKLIETWFINRGRSPYDKPTEEEEAMFALVNMTRITLTDYTDAKAVCDMADYRGLEMPNQVTMCECLKDVCNWGINGLSKPDNKGYTYHPSEWIDFTDQLWLPYIHNLTPYQFANVLVDECLPYRTPVLLADGTSKMIGEIVEGKLSETVLAFDTKTGEQRACRITGWSKTPALKPMVKVTVRGVGKHSTNFVVCTTDHKIWADGKWIEAGKVGVGMVCQIETSAKKSQAYKISNVGKSTLSGVMTGKNDIPGFRSNMTKGTIKVRGGNGKPLPVMQAELLKVLGEDWIAEYAVATNLRGKGQGYPTCYKADLANPGRMIVVEIDGGSHNSPSRKEQDAKKDAFFESKGWTVLRFKNAELRNGGMDAVVAKINECHKENDCPIEAIVINIEPTSIVEDWVYDITVEDCHNFYANGILVHNCQDLNAAQLHLIKKARRSNGKMIFVGDKNQAIFAFAGADCDAFDAITRSLTATVMPLDICYRCPKEVIKLAQIIVPEIQPSPNAPEGVVQVVTERFFFSNVTEQNMILCRTTAPLIENFFKLVKEGKRAKVKGRDFSKQLTKIVDAVAKLQDFDFVKFPEFVTKWMNNQLRAIENKDNADTLRQSICDKADCIQAIYEGAKALNPETLTGIGELRVHVEGIFADESERGVILLSTIHRAKGLEADTVYLLRPDLLPHPMAKTEESQAQEKNLRYVAYTRAMRALYIVDSTGKYDSKPSGG